MSQKVEKCKKKILGALTDNFLFLSAKRSQAAKFQENINENCFKTPLKGIISIKHGNCLLIHGESTAARPICTKNTDSPCINRQ